MNGWGRSGMLMREGGAPPSKVGLLERSSMETEEWLERWKDNSKKGVTQMLGDFREEVTRNNVVLVTTDGVLAVYQLPFEAPNMH